MLGGRNEARRSAGDGVADRRLLVPKLFSVAVSRRAGEHRHGQLGPMSRQVSVFYTGTPYMHISSPYFLCAFYLPLGDCILSKIII